MHRQFRQLFVLLLLLVLILPAAGCVTHRDILELEDHPSGKQTLMTTEDHHYYFLTWTRTLQQWTCTPKGEGLSCKKACGAPGQEKCASYGWLLGNQ